MSHRKTKLDDLSKFRAEQLARNGGFSHRFIASFVFLKPLDRVTDAEVAQVASYLHRNRILLQDWRQGKTPTAAQHAKAVAKAKPKRKRA